MKLPEGNAIVYCEGAFNTPNGKTAHGLVRFTTRYQVIAVVDSRFAGQDAGLVLDEKTNNIPILATLEEAIKVAQGRGKPATHWVVGLAPDGGRLSGPARQDLIAALKKGLNVDAGLHDFLSEDPEIIAIAEQHRVEIRDVRKPPPRSQLHFFSGKIETVQALKVAVLGTDSAIGKRTTAWLLVHALQQAGVKTEMVGTGQTSWMQGAHFGIVLDSLVNDFVSGEIEHAVWTAWETSKPDVIVIEGQGSLMNPAYPGGFEVLAAGRPDIIVMQHAPNRTDYDGFPGYPIQPIATQIQAVELLSGKPVVALTLNHEGLPTEQIRFMCDALRTVTGLPTMDVLLSGAGELVKILKYHLKRKSGFL